jgi:hypothetical protein
MVGKGTHGMGMGGEIVFTSLKNFLQSAQHVGTVYKHNLIILAPGSAEAAGSR